jgi:S1-C subfamily serine protease
MKSRYKQLLWPVLAVDLVLLILVLASGYILFFKNKSTDQSSNSGLPTGTPTVMIMPDEINVNIPENIFAKQDFIITVSVRNPNQKASLIRSIILPRDLMDSVEIKASDPQYQQKNSSDAGEGFAYNLTLNPLENKVFTYTLRAGKMQAINSKIMIDTDLGIQEKSLMMVVLPESQAVAAVDSKAPYQAVVQITSMYKDTNGKLQSSWYGSGSILTKDGLILTNAHVVLPDATLPVDALLVSIEVNQDKPPQAVYYAEVLQADYQLDLAVIQITTDIDHKPIDRSKLNLPVVPVGNSDSLNLGDGLTILGFPSIGGETVTLTKGEVSGFSTQKPYGDRAYIKTSAVITGGNRGGMAVDGQGALVGIPTMMGSGENSADVVDCRYLADTNGDGNIDSRDMCVPAGGFINALRPINLAVPMVDAAKRGEKKIIAEPREVIKLPKGGSIYLQDDFSSQFSGWTYGTDPSNQAFYNNGKYQISVTNQGWVAYGFYTKKEFSDTLVKVKTHVVTQAEDSFYGVICRYKDDGNFYLFTISSDGYYSIQNMHDNQFTSLAPWSFSPIIPKYDDVEIEASCSGNILTLGINNIPIAQVHDSSHMTGNIGLAGGTFSSSNYAVDFDDIVIQAP